MRDRVVRAVAEAIEVPLANRHIADFDAMVTTLLFHRHGAALINQVDRNVIMSRCPNAETTSAALERNRADRLVQLGCGNRIQNYLASSVRLGFNTFRCLPATGNAPMSSPSFFPLPALWVDVERPRLDR